MAITYGNTVHHWCAGVEATVTNKSDTVCTVTVKTYWHSIAWGYSAYGHGYSVADETQGSDSGQIVFRSGTGATVDQLIASTTKDITRTTSNKTVACSGVAIMTGRADANGTSTATVTVTVPKKTSYTVSYNANGGSGAPSSQTKWYGDTLKLSTTKPTRSQYNFLRWNTKADGTGTSYTSGANYTANAKATLYAQWELAYAYPTISNANVVRTDSSSEPQDDGTYGYLTFGWSVDGTADSGTNTVSSVSWSVKESTASAYPSDTAITASGTSGSVAVSIGSGYDVDKTYNVRVTVVDTHGGSYAKYLILTQAFFTLDFGRDGHSIGVGTVASETEDGVVFGSGMPVTFPIQQGTFTIDSTKATLVSYGLRKNGGMGLFTLVDVKLKSPLAAGSTVVIGRLPEGFRPAGDEFMQCCIANGTAYHNIWTKVVWASDASVGGNVEIRNRSGASFPANVAFSVTVPLLI